MLKSVIKSFIAVLGTKGVVLILGFLKSVVLARELGTEGQGQYTIAITIYITVFQIFCMGLHSAQNYYLSKDRKKLPIVWGNSIGISVLCGIFCVIVSIIAGLYGKGENSTAHLVSICILIVPVYLYYYLQQEMLLIIDKVLLMNILDIIVAVISLVLYILLASVHDLSVDTVLIILVFIYVLVDVIGCIVLTSMKTKISFSISFYVKCLKFGVKAFIASFLSFLILKADTYVISYYLGEIEVGKYSIAANLADIVNIFFATLVLVLTPKVTCVEDYNKRYAIMARIVMGISIVAALITCTGEFTCGWFMPILYGEQYYESILIFKILLMGIFFWGIVNIYTLWFYTKKSFKEAIFAYSVAFIMNLVFNLLVVRQWGIGGIAISSVLSYFIAFCILGYLFYKDKYGFI